MCAELISDLCSEMNYLFLWPSTAEQINSAVSQSTSSTSAEDTMKYYLFS